MPAGAFFAGVALLQMLWARLVLVRTTHPVLAVGIILNVGVIALWAVSRTAGAPFGPHAGQAEVVQAADLCALMLQIYVVMGAGWVWYRGLHGESLPAFGSAVVLLGAVGVVALASTVGAASGLRHGHHGPEGAQAGAHHHGAEAEHTEDHDHPGQSAPTAPGDPATDHHQAGTEDADDHHAPEPPATSSPRVDRPADKPGPTPGSADGAATHAPASEPVPAADALENHGDHDHVH